MGTDKQQELLKQLSELQDQMSNGQISKTKAAERLAILISDFKGLNLKNSLTDADYFIIADFLVKDLRDETSPVEIEDYSELLGHIVRAFTGYA